MDFLVKKFISRARPMFTSEELFAKVNPPHKSSFSNCALSSLKHLQKYGFVLTSKGDLDQLVKPLVL